MMIVIIYGHLSVAILNPVFAIAGVVNNKFSWQVRSLRLIIIESVINSSLADGYCIRIC